MFPLAGAESTNSRITAKTIAVETPNIGGPFAASSGQRFMPRDAVAGKQLFGRGVDFGDVSARKLYHGRLPTVSGKGLDQHRGA
jgi:hypothetical protein